MLPDIINGTFETCGAFAILLSVHRLYRDKAVRGFHWGHLTFWILWGLWNLYYYPHLEQWWSFAGGVAVCAVNMAYLGMIVYYSLRKR